MNHFTKFHATLLKCFVLVHSVIKKCRTKLVTTTVEILKWTRLGRICQFFIILIDTNLEYGAANFLSNK